jgi:hypothetical protein
MEMANRREDHVIQLNLFAIPEAWVAGGIQLDAINERER